MSETFTTWSAAGIAIPDRMRGADAVKLPCPRCQHLRRKKRADRPLSVNVSKGLFQCHHCGWNGAIQSLQEQRQLSGTQERRRPERSASELAYAPHELSTPAKDFLRARGITEEIWGQRRIGWDVIPYGPLKGKHALTFPYFAHGRCVNIKYRTLNKEFTQTKGGETCLYGMETVLEGTHTFAVCEGELDALACSTAYVPIPVLSLPNGASSVTDGLMESMQPLLRQCERIYLAGDNDAPGTEAMRELARRIGPERCWLVQWPEGCKDANEALLELGATGVVDAFLQARPWPIQGIVDVGSLGDILAHVYQHGLSRGALLPWASLRPLYSVRPGELTVVTGWSNAGKSSFASAIAVELMKSEGWKVGVFAGEHPSWRYAISMCEQLTGKPWDNTPNVGRMTQQQRLTAQDWLDARLSFLNPPPGEQPTLDYILELARILVFRRGIRLLVIDPWNYLSHKRSAQLRGDEYIGLQLLKILQFCKTYECHCIIVAHPHKPSKNRDGQEQRVPSAYDISGSSEWNNMSDNVLSYVRDRTQNGEDKAKIFVQKIRFREIGRAGTVASLRFDRLTGRYSSDDALHDSAYE